MTLPTDSSPLNPPSEGNGSFDIPSLWGAFVALVREITVQAYKAMRAHPDHQTRRTWEEDTFTCNLEEFIRPIARQCPLMIQVQSQVHVYTDEMIDGTETTKKAAKIDLKMWVPSWEDYDTVYFAWEAKRITDRSLDKANASLVGEYVSEGIFRFIDGAYSHAVNDAGMLGYILVGEASQIVSCINQSMLEPSRTRCLSASDHLQRVSPIGTFGDVYTSKHTRSKSNASIHLTHLFLTFDFAE